MRKAAVREPDMADQPQDSKLRWQAQIEQVVANGKFTDAMTLIHKALAEFPDDAALLSLEEKVTQARERSVQVFQLVEEGRALCGEGKFDEGIETLRGAYSLDERNQLARSALIDNLLCRALAVLETDFATAEKLSQEAMALDPLNPVNKSVVQSIREYRESKPAAAAPGLATTVVQPATASTAPATKPVPGSGLAPRLASRATVMQPKAPAPLQSMSGPTLPAAAAGAATAATSVPSSAGASKVATSVAPSSATIPSATKTMSGRVPPPPAATPAAPSSTDTQPVEISPSLPRSAAAKALRRGSWPRFARTSLGTLAIAALAIVLCGGLLVMALRHQSNKQEFVSVSIHTVPAGAAVRINGKPYNIAQEISLARGNYTIEADLDGYQTLSQDIQLSDQKRRSIELTLSPVMPALRIATDLASGSVAVDDQPPLDLQNGQFALGALPRGEHTLRITSDKTSEALIGFAVAGNVAPVLAHPINAKNLRVVMLGSYGGQGRLYSSFGPASLRVDGQMVGRIAPENPLTLPNLPAASHELDLGDADDRQSISVDVGISAALFISVTSDRNVGTLEVVANEKDFQLQIDGKPAKVVTQRGRTFVYNLDAKSTIVQIAKTGFDAAPSQLDVVIRKGAIARAIFHLSAVPTTATLHMAGVLSGTRVTLDEKPYDLQPDGTLRATIAPGEHVIELTRAGFRPRIVRVSAKAGETVSVSGAEVLVSDANTGKLTISSRTPATASVILRRGSNDTPISERDMELPEGDYTLIAAAPGFRGESRPVHIDGSNPAVVDVRLTAIPQIVHMEGWEDPNAWRLDNGWYTRKGGSFVLFQGLSNAGTIEFTARHKGRQLPIFRGGHISWVVRYIDARNYDLYELDEQKISWKRFVDGKPGTEKQQPLGVKIKDQTFRVRVDVGGPEIMTQIFDGQAWKALPEVAASGAAPAGRFGFYLAGDDELWFKDFAFNPKQ